eukprot:5031840-Pyramimonas_sp.AAC.1
MGPQRCSSWGPMGTSSKLKGAPRLSRAYNGLAQLIRAQQSLGRLGRAKSGLPGRTTAYKN